jgi:hypothetical protein
MGRGDDELRYIVDIDGQLVGLPAERMTGGMWGRRNYAGVSDTTWQNLGR